MTALLMADMSGAEPVCLQRRSLARSGATSSAALIAGADGTDPAAQPSGNMAGTAAASYDEKWLQELLFRHPELILLDGIETSSGGVVPLCRELPIPRPGGNVFLDVLGVTRTGRLVLIECKLWRNPQARREVIAQIVEYAALLRSWSFGDLTARLKQKLGSTHANPIFAQAEKHWPDLDEADFVDGITNSLAHGDFALIIAGDGIRSDLHAVASHLNGQRAGLAKLSLLEIQLWSSGSGQTLIIPTIPLRTEVLQQRVIISETGMPLRLEEPTSSETGDVATTAIERTINPGQAERKALDRAFWQRFIEEVRFDHPDQVPARHGGANWVKMDLPDPAGWLTAFRSSGAKEEIGLFLRLKGDDGRRLFDELAADLETLRSESDLPLFAQVRAEQPFEADLGVSRLRSAFADEDQQLLWLKDAANRFITMIRPRLSQFSETAA